ncbi:putative tricarboxylic transport membrane protein [Aliiruegeria haliotis]|uniref:Putative tricarboxylic transport membrane protein n=1 Tax=Aliiruegeria haliotis TaxID=1280846 RepID=A0A2T0RID0_9RHOB|nr:tripartite tricarboxylate transporter TctB family protein [Aliiruegeria haliotis]PRY20935.1 putative tricarboxylic transport membrane protein [Aliiruegeria haliotis]
MKISDRLTGCFLLVFATAILFEASSFPVIPGQSIGSALLPNIVAIGLIGCAIILIVSDLVGSPRPRLAEAGDWITDPRRLLRVGIVLLGTASFIPFMDVIGFPVLSITVLLAFLLSLRVDILTAILVSVTASLAIHTLFSKVFLVPLPWGVLQSIAW